MDRVFLDANVLFSAAYRETAGLLQLWELPEVELTTSAYAAEEAHRNLESETARNRLKALLGRVRIVPETGEESLPGGFAIAEKDKPIILSAIAAGATHLLTGDLRDFGKFFGKRIGDVLIQTPGDYLRSAK
jgi:uncharacterized protein